MTDKGENEVNKDERVNDGVDPAHHCSNDYIFTLFPPCEGDISGYVYVEQKEFEYGKPWRAHPYYPCEVYDADYSKSKPSEGFGGVEACLEVIGEVCFRHGWGLFRLAKLIKSIGKGKRGACFFAFCVVRGAAFASFVSLLSFTGALAFGRRSGVLPEFMSDTLGILAKEP